MGKIDSHLLIIGGTGFIGRHLVLAAKKKGYIVTSASLNYPKKENIIDGVKYYEVDLCNIETAKKFLTKPYDYVVNLGGYIDHSDFKNGGKKVIDAHYTGVYEIVTKLKKDNLKKFIQIGSSDEYGEAKAPQSEDLRELPITPYAFAKIASTHFLQMLYKTEDFPVTILRLFLTYGPAQDTNRFLPQVITACIKNKSFPTTLGSQIRDFCYIDDTINAIMKMLVSKNTNGEIFNLGSGIPRTVKSVINIIQKQLSKGKPLYGALNLRKNENMNLYSDNQKILKYIDWKPEIDIEEGIKRTIKFYKEINE